MWSITGGSSPAPPAIPLEGAFCSFCRLLVLSVAAILTHQLEHARIASVRWSILRPCELSYLRYSTGLKVNMARERQVSAAGTSRVCIFCLTCLSTWNHSRTSLSRCRFRWKWFGICFCWSSWPNWCQLLNAYEAERKSETWWDTTVDSLYMDESE